MATAFRASSTARRRRMVDGALLLDKPVGLTSNAALQKAKKALRAAKAGHAGTLDPLASGLLIVLFGEATKFAGPLLDADKEYVATLKLGERTTTGDAEGEVIRPGRSASRGLPRYWKDSRARSSRCRRCIPRSSIRGRRSTGSRGGAKKSRARRARCASRSLKCSNPRRRASCYAWSAARARISARSPRTSARRSAAARISPVCAVRVRGVSALKTHSASTLWTRIACCRYPRSWRVWRA